jgi:hypothetical protein
MFVSGVRSLLNRSPDLERDSFLSKKLLSPYTRYWIGRYYAGLTGIGACFAFLALAVILYLAK